MDPYAEPTMTKKKALILIVLGIILLLLIIIPFIKWRDNKVETDTQNQAQLIIESYSPLFTAGDDTDGDGIPNWLEQLYGTDPNVPDADKIPADVRASLADGTIRDKSDVNLTHTVGRDLYVTGSYMVATGSSLTAEAAGTGLANEVRSVLIPQKIGSFATVEDSPTVVKNYLNMAGEVIFIITNSHSYVETLDKYMEETGSLAEIKTDYPRFVDLCDRLKNSSVPRSYSALHTELVFQCDQQQNIIHAFANADSDPLRALAAASLFISNAEAAVGSLQAFATRVEKDNTISFRTNEYGYIFKALINELKNL